MNRHDDKPLPVWASEIMMATTGMQEHEACALQRGEDGLTGDSRDLRQRYTAIWTSSARVC